MSGPEPGWARLSAGLINDRRWLGCTAHGRLVFVTSIALAKAAQEDGLVSLRAMVGIQWGALEPAEVESAAAELVRCGLWEHVENDIYRVVSFLKWNEDE